MFPFQLVRTQTAQLCGSYSLFRELLQPRALGQLEDRRSLGNEPMHLSKAGPASSTDYGLLKGYLQAPTPQVP